jgi:hypothetical protein
MLKKGRERTGTVSREAREGREGNMKRQGIGGGDWTEGSGKGYRAMIKRKIRSRIKNGSLTGRGQINHWQEAGGVIETGSAFMRKRVGQP